MVHRGYAIYFLTEGVAVYIQELMKLWKVFLISNKILHIQIVGTREFLENISVDTFDPDYEISTKGPDVSGGIGKTDKPQFIKVSDGLHAN